MLRLARKAGIMVKKEQSPHYIPELDPNHSLNKPNWHNRIALTSGVIFLVSVFVWFIAPLVGLAFIHPLFEIVMCVSAAIVCLYLIAAAFGTLF